MRPVDKVVPTTGSFVESVAAAKKTPAQTIVMQSGDTKTRAGDHFETVAGGPKPSANTAAAPASAPADSAIGKKILRDPAFATKFCNRFNANLHLAPADLKEKTRLMAKSPLKFFRCMPPLFYRDVLGPYADLAKLSDRPAPTVMLAGDAHLGNFGTYRAPDGKVVWGLNDFDMTCSGPAAWDLERLAASTMLALKDAGMSLPDGDPLIHRLVKAYVAELHNIASGGKYPCSGLTHGETSGAIHDLIKSSSDANPEHLAKKYAKQNTDGSWHFVASDELELVGVATHQAVVKSLEQYDKAQRPTPAVKRPLHIYDVGLKLGSGGSSYGQPRYYAMVDAADAKAPPVFLEIKQELPSPLVDWTGDLSKSDAAAVVAGQRALGCDNNPLNGSTKIDGISYLVREREPQKGALDDDSLKTTEGIKGFLEAAGTMMARAHAPNNEQANKILNWIGTDTGAFSGRLEDFARLYEKQTKADCEAFASAH